MSRRNQNFIRKFFPYFTVVVIGALIVLGVYLFADGPKKQTDPSGTEPSKISTEKPDTEDTKETAPSDTSESPTETEDPTKNAGFPTVSAVEAVQVDQLIDRYYTAKLNNNAEELNKIVDTEKPYTVADLQAESQYITKYDSFRTYITPGPTDNTYVAYVRYNIYFNGINTGAPALNRFVIHKDTDGYYCIFDRPISDEFQTYLIETEKSENVAALIKEVNEQLEEACASNEDLNYFIEILKGKKEPEVTSAPETDEADTSASEEETPAEEAEADQAEEE